VEEELWDFPKKLNDHAEEEDDDLDDLDEDDDDKNTLQLAEGFIVKNTSVGRVVVVTQPAWHT